jgi:hypothetical protein
MMQPGRSNVEQACLTVGKTGWRHWRCSCTVTLLEKLGREKECWLLKLHYCIPLNRGLRDNLIAELYQLPEEAMSLATLTLQVVVQLSRRLAHPEQRHEDSTAGPSRAVAAAQCSLAFITFSVFLIKWIHDVSRVLRQMHIWTQPRAS